LAALGSGAAINHANEQAFDIVKMAIVSWAIVKATQQISDAAIGFYSIETDLQQPASSMVTEYIPLSF